MLNEASDPRSEFVYCGHTCIIRHTELSLALAARPGKFDSSPDYAQYYAHPAHPLATTGYAAPTANPPEAIENTTPSQRGATRPNYSSSPEFWFGTRRPEVRILSPRPFIPLQSFGLADCTPLPDRERLVTRRFPPQACAAYADHMLLMAEGLVLSWCFAFTMPDSIPWSRAV